MIAQKSMQTPSIWVPLRFLQAVSSCSPPVGSSAALCPTKISTLFEMESGARSRAGFFSPEGSSFGCALDINHIYTRSTYHDQDYQP